MRLIIHKYFSILFISVITIFSLPEIRANNIQVSNVQIIHKSSDEHWAAIQFDLNYENAWRINTGASNWSAAWIFIKFKLSDGIWRHATISPNVAHHYMPQNVMCSTTADGKGIFIYDSRVNTGDYNFSGSGITIRWNYGVDGVADNEASVDIKLFSLEMVYVPEGSYYLGSGGSETNAFYQYPNTNTPYLVNSESTNINVDNINGNLYYNNMNFQGGDRQGPITAVFPKGFMGFYAMRYEISQEQYVDFLNTLTRTQQNTRTQSDVSGDIVTESFVMSGTANMSSRNGIRCPETGNGTTNPIVFFCDYNQNGTPNEPDDGQSIACGYLTWFDGLAYMDWAGLRPMTELEFEKSCRGTNMPVANEFPWGSTAFVLASATIVNEGQASELNSNSGNGLSNIDSQLDGPLRCGFSATATTNKIQSGSSFYGIQNLGDNLTERCISIGSPEGRSFTGNHGDGALDLTGNYTSDTGWPGVPGESGRGGNFLRQSFRMCISNRSFGLSLLSTRYQHWGIRGVRTAE